MLFLFLLLLSCLGCTNQKQEKANYLDNELDSVSILSSTFDSLLLEVRELPRSQQVGILLKILSHDVLSYKGLLKQNKLLEEFLPLTSKQEKKKVLLQGITISCK